MKFQPCTTAMLALLMLGLTACINAETIGYSGSDGGGDSDVVAPTVDTAVTATDMDVVVATPDAATDSGVAQDISTSILPVLCGGIVCAAGDTCCLSTGSCFNANTDRGACPTPTTGSGACASNLDCAPGAYCAADVGSGCVGPGQCVQTDSCGTCESRSPDGCTVCGCDGMNYPSIQTACLAGVRTANVHGACGTPDVTPLGDSGVNLVRIPCATSTQCPSGQQCCPYTTVCFDATCLDCCRLPPAGTDFPCDDNSQCYPGEYCAGNGCGMPGGCSGIRGTGDCSGVVEQACGCDGRTYVNDCWATGSGVRVAHDGGCP